MVAIISFIGITIAVAALIIVMSVMSGFRATLLDALLGGQGHVFVMVQDTAQEDVDELVLQLEELDQVVSASPIIQRQVLASSDYTKVGALVRGVRVDDLEKFPFFENPIAKAKADGFGDGRFGGNKVYVGVFLSEALWGRFDTSLAKEVRIITAEQNQTALGGAPRSKNYLLADSFRTGSVELDQLLIFMPVEQAQVLFKNRGQYDLIDVRVKDPINPDKAVEQIRTLTLGQFRIDTLRRQRAQYFGALNTERAMMRLIMLILITITALNIITGVVMLVKNKTRDIAILRTVGTSRGSVMRVFIMVGASLGMAGAFFGLLIGVAFVGNLDSIQNGLREIGIDLFPATVYQLENLPAILDWGEVVFTSVWAMSMSILVTIWPAWAAARLDPVEALRFE